MSSESRRNYWLIIIAVQLIIFRRIIIVSCDSGRLIQNVFESKLLLMCYPGLRSLIRTYCSSRNHMSLVAVFFVVRDFNKVGGGAAK